MKKQKLFNIFLVAAIVCWSMPRSAYAALFTENAEAAVVVKDAEASEVGLVSPAAGNTAVLAGAGTGTTTLGQNFLDYVKNAFIGLQEEPIAPATTEIQEPVEMIEQMDSQTVQLTEEPSDEKAAAAGALAVGIAVEEMVAQPAPVEAITPSEIAEDQTASTEEAAAEEAQDEKALFPVLATGTAAAATGAAAGAREDSFLGSRAGVLTAGFLLIALALGIILPLTLGDGNGGSGDGAGSGDGFGDGFGGGSGDGEPDGGGSGDGDGSGSGSNPVPEPFSLALFGMGLVGLFLKRKSA